MKPVFIDSSVVLLAIGSDHPLRAANRQVLSAAAEGLVRLHLSVESGQEFLFHRMRRGSRADALALFEQLDALVVWHPFDAEILHAARDLMRSSEIRGRDAVIAATAHAGGFTSIVSSDSDFDHIPGLTRLDPEADWPQVITP